MKGIQKDTTTRFVVLAKGPRCEREFHGSLHYMFDEARQNGITLPHGLWYIGPVSRGLLQPVDEKLLEAVYNPALIQSSEIRAFLAELGIIASEE